MAVSGYIAGAISDFLIKSGYSLTLVRKVMQSIGFIGPGVSLLFLNYAKTPEMASVFITIALSLSLLAKPGFSLICKILHQSTQDFFMVFRILLGHLQLS